MAVRLGARVLRDLTRKASAPAGFRRGQPAATVCLVRLCIALLIGVLLAPVALVDLGNVLVLRSTLSKVSTAKQGQAVRDAVTLFGYAGAWPLVAATAYRAKGRSLMLSGLDTQAAEAFHHALAVDPSDLMSAYALGSLLERNGDQAAAAGVWQPFPSIVDSRISRRLDAGKLALANGDRQNAGAWFAQADILAQHAPDTYYAIADIFVGAGLPESAEHYLSLGLSVDHSDSFARLRAAGQLAYLREEWSAAAEAFSRAVALRPGDVRLLVLNAAAEASEGHLPEADVLFRRAEGLRPQQPDVLYVLGGYELSRGCPRRAAWFVSQVVAVAPSTPGARELLDRATRAAQAPEPREHDCGGPPLEDPPAQ